MKIRFQGLPEIILDVRSNVNQAGIGSRLGRTASINVNPSPVGSENVFKQSILNTISAENIWSARGL